MLQNKLTIEDELRIIKDLEEFDTPTITNVVATFPSAKECLGLYNPQQVDWYTDNQLKCLYPELGPRCGYAVTAVYGMVDPSYKRLEFKDILEAIAEVDGPVILLLKENFSKKMKRKNALIGGNMMTAFRQLGVVGVLGDAPARDIDEMRSLGVQCMFPGTVAGHGTMSIEAVNIPVNMSGMDVAPMEIVHMDESGAVKFPRKYLSEVLKCAKAMRDYDNARTNRMKLTADQAELADIMKGIFR